MNMIRTLICLMIIAPAAWSDVPRRRVDHLVLESIPEIPASIVERLQPYQNVRSAVFVDWLPGDAGLLVRTRFGESSQIHAVEVPRGMRRQLTFFTEPVNECVVCPDPRREVFLFTRDSAGNEVDQIYAYDLARGTYARLSDGRSKHRAVVWAHKGDRFAFSSTKRNGRDFDIYLGDLSGSKNFRVILQEDGYWYPVAFSPDDRRLLAKQYVSSDESYYFILDLASRALTPLHEDTARIAYGAACWAPDGRAVYVVADWQSEHRRLLRRDLQTKEFKVLTGQIPWDITEVEIAPAGKTLAFTSNEDGVSRLYLMDLATGGLSRVTMPDGLIYNLIFKPGGNELAVTINRATQQADVYSFNLGTRKFIRWTYSELGGLDTMAFVAPKLIRYQTFDSADGMPRTIPAYYYEPKKFKPPYPVLIDCHGGPAGQERPYFSSTIQFYAGEMGIAVIAPNVRGSTGYGRAFMALDDGDRREDAVRDIGCLLDWIEKQPQLDRRRVAISGGSYGGYMVLASLTHYSNRLCCGIDGWGISNFVSFLENTGEYRQDLRREEYGDERDPRMREFLKRISPLTNAHKITKPMLVVQGLHDPRVPVSEAEQIVKAARQNRVDVWYLLAEDEGHGFGRKSNYNIYQQIKVLFLEKFLLKKNKAIQGN